MGQESGWPHLLLGAWGDARVARAAMLPPRPRLGRGRLRDVTPYQALMLMRRTALLGPARSQVCWRQTPLAVGAACRARRLASSQRPRSSVSAPCA